MHTGPRCMRVRDALPSSATEREPPAAAITTKHSHDAEPGEHRRGCAAPGVETRPTRQTPESQRASTKRAA